MADLKKELGLTDVYVVCTGAMFSAGFFLLPGLATEKAGPSVVLAYFLAGVIMLPSLLSMAELSTAMPRASGSYFFIDRTTGPLMSTIGGIGTWLALVFESAFALIGIGAYSNLFFDVSITPVAIALTLAFGALNLFGAKETTGLQRFLVFGLIAVMAFFLTEGLVSLTSQGNELIDRQRFTPLFTEGAYGLLHATAFVFVAYAGVTKAASVSEEVIDPDRSIPRGMLFALATATVIYVVGVFILVSTLDSDSLRGDLTPVASSAEQFMTWLPGEWGLYIVVAAAIAAFASTGNAGILAASRYPLAMAKDKLIPEFFGRMSKSKTPTVAIIATVLIMVFFELILSPGGVAEFASATQLLIFSLINLAVIIMRESGIEEYRPGFKSPLYPWMQIFGALGSLILVGLLGWTPLISALALICFGLFWYFYYVKSRVERRGAMYHVFSKIGEERYEPLSDELREINEEKEEGQSEEKSVKEEEEKRENEKGEKDKEDKG
ncbi:MAG: APC family permease [Hymenobacteraceae bacterium]|nr:APC family permease [Hymenobacteraceae bacterium]